MVLYHSTLKSNLESIRKHGLDPVLSKGVDQVIWLHTQSRIQWASRHLRKRHKCDLDDIVVLMVNIPRSRLQRRWRGIWITREPISEIQYARL